ncbi:unnamed protein product [Didymodactylos carnosus]|uniref:Exonuclease domain-containing protein n=1 Tax=Didymodactylos carnosus TaxID=1234261 RepID=A0A8S2FK35_9BILA|nr:unnamed protein product [Didymodactylos carnosus]CAF4280939.1 unnamed protein product [Didymodactylos carnosus]
MASFVEAPTKQKYDYFLVLDFEATCDEKNPPHPQEIIEFPVLKINGKTFICESIFHMYVLPKENPKLTEFCINLTGITQDMVDNQLYLEKVLELFHEWLIEQDLLNKQFTFVTCGDWDLKTMLRSQCQHFNIERQEYFRQWVNIKRSYNEFLNSKSNRGMMGMLNGLNLTHEGRHHSGIDDCKNIAKILKELAERGYIYEQNGK